MGKFSELDGQAGWQMPTQDPVVPEETVTIRKDLIVHMENTLEALQMQVQELQQKYEIEKYICKRLEAEKERGWRGSKPTSLEKPASYLISPPP